MKKDQSRFMSDIASHFGMLCTGISRFKVAKTAGKRIKTCEQ